MSRNMDRHKQKLEQEKSFLTEYIALNDPSGSALGARSTPRNGNIPRTHYNPQFFYPHEYPRSHSVVSHALFRPPAAVVSVVSGSQSVPSASTYKYATPMQAHAIQQHQNVSACSGFISKSNGKAEDVLSYSGFGNTNPYWDTMKKVNTELSNVTSVPSSTLSLPSRIQIPKSVYINPAHLVSSAGPLPYPSTSTTSSSFKIRPHINRQHVAYHQICSLPGTVVSPSPAVVATVTSSQSDSTYIYKNVTVTSARSENQSFPYQDYSSYVTNFGNSRELPKSQTAIKSKYKVDRRLKPSPDKQRALNSRRIKIVKKYSTKLVSHPSSSPLSTLKKTTIHLDSLGKPTSTFPPKQFHKSWMKPFNTSFRPNPKNNVYRKGSPKHRQRLSRRMIKLLNKSKNVHSPKKAIVNIGGNNYLRKNSGRTLRKMKPRSPAVVNIAGSQFISKNSGKSLKRLFRQPHTPRQKKISISPCPTLTIEKRLAQRAVVKSKLTLLQRTWRKQRFCVYYNRLGECKKNEEGNCPYVHDKKQLSICPKFVVGKCNIADCKLSHDLNVGRMPPCQFFNKSNCSRENCPYPHIKSTIVKKKTPKSEKIKGKEEEKDLRTITGTPRRRKLSIKKEKSSSKCSKTKDNEKSRSDNQEKPNARYFEQSPDSQPVVSIIPRRIRLEEIPPATGTNVTKKLNDGSLQITNQSNSSNDEACSSTNNTDAKVLQRARLMQRVSRLKEKVKPRAPQFLPFK